MMKSLLRTAIFSALLALGRKAWSLPRTAAEPRRVASDASGHPASLTKIVRAARSNAGRALAGALWDESAPYGCTATIHTHCLHDQAAFWLRWMTTVRRSVALTPSDDHDAELDSVRAPDPVAGCRAGVLAALEEHAALRNLTVLLRSCDRNPRRCASRREGSRPTHRS